MRAVWFFPPLETPPLGLLKQYSLPVYYNNKHFHDQYISRESKEKYRSDHSKKKKGSKIQVGLATTMVFISNYTRLQSTNLREGKKHAMLSASWYLKIGKEGNFVILRVMYFKLLFKKEWTQTQHGQKRTKGSVFCSQLHLAFGVLSAIRGSLIMFLSLLPPKQLLQGHSRPSEWRHHSG